MCLSALVSGGTGVLFGVDHVLVSAGLWWDWCPFWCRPCACQRWSLVGLVSLGLDHVLFSAGLWLDWCPFWCFVLRAIAWMSRSSGVSATGRRVITIGLWYRVLAKQVATLVA